MWGLSNLNIGSTTEEVNANNIRGGGATWESFPVSAPGARAGSRSSYHHPQHPHYQQHHQQYRQNRQHHWQRQPPKHSKPRTIIRSSDDDDNYAWGPSLYQNPQLNSLGIVSHKETARNEIRYSRRLSRTAILASRPQPSSTRHDTSLSAPHLPPRNPHRVHKPDLNWRPSSSVYDEVEDVASEESDPNHSQLSLENYESLVGPSSSSSVDLIAVIDKMQRQPIEQISPPSSPDIDAADQEELLGDVSPMEEDPNPFESSKTRTPQAPTQSGTSKPKTPPSHQNASSGNPIPTSPSSPSSPSRSNIPTMRRDRRKQQDAAAAASRLSKTKEQLSERRDLPSQRNLQRISMGAWAPPQRQENHLADAFVPHSSEQFGSTTVITGPRVHRSSGIASPVFGQRTKGSERSRPQPLDSRPPWNGASGREVQVRPVRDDYTVRPLNIAPKSTAARTAAARQTSPRDSLIKAGNGAATAMRNMLQSKSRQRSHDSSPLSSPEPIPPTATPTHSYPSPPYTSPVQSTQPEMMATLPSLPSNQHHLPTGDSFVEADPPVKEGLPTYSEPEMRVPALNPLAAHPTQHSPPELRISMASPTADDEPLKRSISDDRWTQPASRFSVTTCATSRADSPHPSMDENRPPMPTPPEQSHSSVMSRKRPVRDNEGHKSSPNDPILISIKTSQSPTVRSPEALERAAREKSPPPFHIRTISTMKPPEKKGNTGGAGRRSSVMSLSKALPLAPPEISSANDRVANLNARLAGLAHRRDNINRSIRQMTELMPQDNLMASAEVLNKRAVEKKKVEMLREELAFIQQEEYDLGLKLHRAYKRLDREAEYEPTGLWVRRVTS